MNLDAIQQLIAKASASKTLPAELAKLLGELLQLLDGISSLNDLKKPGAWRDKPLPANSPDKPYWIKPPLNIDIVNLPPAVLRKELPHVRPEEDGHGNCLVTILPLLQHPVPENPQH